MPITIAKPRNGAVIASARTASTVAETNAPQVRALIVRRRRARALLLQVAAGRDWLGSVSDAVLRGLPARHTADFWSIWGGTALDRSVRVSETTATGTS